jgi:hypothetical protein
LGDRTLASVEVYDPSTESWSAGVSLPSEVNHGTAITVNGKIYLVGGRNASDQNIIKFFALIHPQINGLQKQTCQQLEYGQNLFGLKIEFGQ